MLDTLLEAEKNHEIDAQGICDEVATFLVAGYDTTKTATMFILFTIAQYPDVQEKIYDEVSLIYGKCQNNLTKGWERILWTPKKESKERQKMRNLPYQLPRKEKSDMWVRPQ